MLAVSVPLVEVRLETEMLMSGVSLLVTSPVLAHTGEDPREKQIAVRLASKDIADALAAITAGARRELVLGGCITLNIGDPGAIWRAHNVDGLDDFDALFDLLARRPDQEMRFLCDLR